MTLNQLSARSWHFNSLQGRMIVKAFVELGRDIFNTKSSSHVELKPWFIMVPYAACFHFIGLFCCYEALTVNAEKTCKKRC